VLRGAVVALAALVLAGAATTAGALYLTRDRQAAPALRPAPPPPRHRTSGTVQLTTRPADATITISGEPLHVGSPWSIELAPGTHQIEVVHDGYKGWLTSIDLATGETKQVQVTLDPLGTAVAADATLVIGSTPTALEVALDGKVMARTPITLPIALGPHTVVLRADGAEVWRKEIDARASAVYEFHPTIAAPAAEPPAAEPPEGSEPLAAGAVHDRGPAPASPPEGNDPPQGNDPPAPAESTDHPVHDH